MLAASQPAGVDKRSVWKTRAMEKVIQVTETLGFFTSSPPIIKRIEKYKRKGRKTRMTKSTEQLLQERYNMTYYNIT